MGKPTVKKISGFLRKGIGNDPVDFVSRWRSAATGNEENEVYTTEDFASAFLRFENDPAMTMEVSWALNGEEDDALKLDIFGTKGGVSLSPPEMAAFIDGCNSPWIGSYLDVGNVLVNGYPEDWITTLGPRISSVHVKDFLESVGNIHGFVPLFSGDVR